MLREETRYYGVIDMFYFAKENGMTEEILHRLVKHRPELWKHYTKTVKIKENSNGKKIAYSFLE